MARTLLAAAAAIALTAPLGAATPEPDRHAPAEKAEQHDVAHSTPAETPGAAGHGDGAVPAQRRAAAFAAELAQMPPLQGPDAWHGSRDWAPLARASRDRRQAVRWSHALGLIARDRAAEALGVLSAMRGDDDDLALVPAFQLAHGVVLAQLHRHEEALGSLAGPGLAANPEACAWRMRTLAEAQLHEQALRELRCALPAINARRIAQRTPFLHAAAAAAIETGRGGAALEWLKPLDDRDPGANLLRGRAYLALGEAQAGRLRLERALLSGNPEQRADARLALLEAEMAQGSVPPEQAIERLDALRFGWRGGPVEERALRLSLTLAADAHDVRATLRSGAALFRYFEPGSEAGTMLTRLQAALAAALAPDSDMPLPEAAGLYWDYRELAPAGVEGDRLAIGLAGRLQAAGLYARAADLLEYQLRRRAEDVAQGPLSVRVATLHLLAGRPDRALRALRESEQPSYTDAMRWDRKRMEAVALNQAGKAEAAIAALEGVPGSEALRAELQWHRRDWGSYVAISEGELPARGSLGEAAQAAVLRHAVALAMLRREERLQALRARYADAFAKLPSAGVFDLLTRPAGAVDPATLSTAMAAIPGASPAGDLGDLIEAAPRRGG